MNQATPPTDALRQDQFLTVLPRDEALRRFVEALAPAPGAAESVPLAEALGRVLAEDSRLAVRRAALRPRRRRRLRAALRRRRRGGGGPPAPRSRLNGEIVACGVRAAPAGRSRDGDAHRHRRPDSARRGRRGDDRAHGTGPGRRASGAARRRRRARTSPSPAPTSPAARRSCARGTVIGSREIGMLAACGLARCRSIRRPRVGVLSTGDELVAPGVPLRPAALYDCNGPILCAAVARERRRARSPRHRPRRRDGARSRPAAGARGMRRRPPLRRHLEGGGRSHLSASSRAWARRASSPTASR